MSDKNGWESLQLMKILSFREQFASVPNGYEMSKFPQRFVQPRFFSSCSVGAAIVAADNENITTTTSCTSTSIMMMGCSCNCIPCEEATAGLPLGKKLLCIQNSYIFVNCETFLGNHEENVFQVD